MLKPTNDPLDVMRRNQTTAKKATDTALDASGTQPEQVVRKLRAQVAALEVVVEQMVELFNRMPQNDGRQVDETGWTTIEPPTWTTVASATIPRPGQTNRAAVMAVGLVAGMRDALPAYLASISARILINGVQSTVTPGTGSISTGTYFGSVNIGFFHELSGLGSDVVVELQVLGAFNMIPAQNRASLSVSVGFTKVG